VARRGVRFVGSVEAVAEVPKPDHSRKEKTEADYQHVKFCNSRDGTRIAYANTGSGHPLVKAGHWLTYLEYDWRGPLWRPFLNELNGHVRVTRYDQRGNGLSDWSVEDFSLESFVEDLEPVIEAAGLETYACRHPDRVSHLILHGVPERTACQDVSQRARRRRSNLDSHPLRLGQARQPLHQAFSSMFIPDSTREEIDSLAELQKLTTSPENAARIREAVDRFDVSHLLEHVRCPTLVFHARDDGIHPVDQGRKLAAGIRGAEFVMLESANHVVLPHEPAWSVLFDTMMRFIESTASRA
jgi:pimeloyl-ACP methyl ester carboxylesterase